MGKDFISSYLEYRAKTEPPLFFHRWSIISALGAWLARDVSFELGDFKIYPNQYVMLIGVPGTRKSTAIKLAKKLLTAAGYDHFSAEKSSKEKFILDLAGDDAEMDQDIKDLISENLWGESGGNISEMYVACDEFNNFIGNGNIEFISLLGELWDYSGVYSNRIKNGKSVSVPDPTVNILGGNTATGFSLAFPSQSIGQGFFSRLLLIYSEPSERKIPFPEPTPVEYTNELVRLLGDIKRIATTSGVLSISPMGRHLLAKIYASANKVDDVRFEHYANRRYTHLIKLCIICALANYRIEILEEDVVYANTILTHTERYMPKALGEFGQSKNSAVNHKILSALEAATKPMLIPDIWRHVSSDLDKMTDLSNSLQGLMSAGKIQRAGDGFLAKKLLMEVEYSDVVNYDYLTREEAGPMAREVPESKPRLEVVGNGYE